MPLSMNTPGVTRDRNYGTLEWAGRELTVIDTGGFVPDSKNIFEQAIVEQAQYAVDEADAIVLVVDGEAGPHPLDEELANILRKKSKKVILAVNKIDDAKHEKNTSQFFEPRLSKRGRNFCAAWKKCRRFSGRDNQTNTRWQKSGRIFRCKKNCDHRETQCW